MEQIAYLTVCDSIIDLCRNGKCSEDEYQRDQKICLHFLREGRFPMLPKGEGCIENITRLQAMAHQLKIIRCKYGTEHLFHKKKMMRIPMILQCEHIVRQLLSSEIQRNQGQIENILRNQSTIEPANVMKVVEKVIKSQIHPFEIELWENPDSYIQTIAQNYGVTEKEAELIINRTHWSKIVKGATFKTYQENSNIKATFLCSSSMKCNYYKYGEMMMITALSNVICRKQDSGRSYLSYILSGCDNYGGIVLFGVILVSTSSVLYHEKCLELFFTSVQKLPAIIITSDSKPLTATLQKMKQIHNFSYSNYINWFYIVQKLKGQSATQLEQQKILQLFCKCLCEPFPLKLARIKKQIQSQMANTKSYNNFVKDQSKYCLSKVQPVFIGDGLSTQRIEQIYNLLEQKIEYSRNMGGYFRHIFSIQHNLELLRDYRIGLTREQLFSMIRSLCFEFNWLNDGDERQEQIEELLRVSKMISSSIFRQLLKNYLKSLQHFIRISNYDENALSYEIIQEENSKNRSILHVRYSFEDFCWKCNCREIYFTGLPCPHLVKIVLKQGGSLQYYVNSRWVCGEVEGEVEVEVEEGVEVEVEEGVEMEV